MFKITPGSTIAVDVDAVLFPFLEETLVFLDEVYGIKLTVKDVKHFDIWRAYNGTPEDAIEKVGRFFEQEHLLQVPPIEKAREVLERHKNRYRFHVVSGRAANLNRHTAEWIDRHLPGVFQGIVLGNHYVLQGAKVTKSELCRQVGATVLIDDHLGYILECARAGISGILYGYGYYEYNRAEQLPDNVTAARDWEAVDELLR